LLFSKILENFPDKNIKLNILDLGCGTGLVGEKFQQIAKKLIGLDLSQKMLEIAKQKNIYTELKLGNIEDVIDEYSNIDLIIASDTFVYIGDLTKIFIKCHNALAQDGLLAFTTEKTTHYPFTLQRSARFAHSKRYIEELAAKHNFTILSEELTTIRTQQNKPVESYIYILKVMVDCTQPI
jgi:predicted TPR repeat methyltransferase